MKSKVQFQMLGLILCCLVGTLAAQRSDDFQKYCQTMDSDNQTLIWRQYQEVRDWFEEAYREYPTVPRGALEAVAFQYTRFSINLSYDTVETDMSVMPRTYSIMGLTLQGKGVFRENVRLLAESTPYPLEDILWTPGVAVKAYACAFAQLQQRYKCYGDSVECYKQIFVDLCELPLLQPGEDQFAMNSFLYMLYWFLNQEDCVRYGVPRRHVDFDRLFGSEYARLRCGRAEVLPVEPLRSSNGTTDYPNAISVPAASCNYTQGRNGVTISAVTIHYTQGTYSGAIAWFQNCNARASAHYVVRSVDGQVTQMVREADKAWHVRSENGYTIGIEHEAYGDIASYFTMNMYQSSADLVKNICSRRPNILPYRVFYRDTLDDGTALNYGVHSLGGATACTQIRGHQHFPSQTHTDPGPYWNWNLYYKLINDNPVVTVATTESGTFTDSGGLTGSYGDDERRLFLIHVDGADSVALTFSQFSLEADYDFIWIYAGGTVFSPLIGRWNTESPGRVVATGDKMLVEFRSDCATNGPGWTAQWQACYQSDDDGGDSGGGTGGDDDDNSDDDDWDDDDDVPVVDNENPQTQINMDASQWITGNFLAPFTDTDDSGIKWRFYQIIESTGSEWTASPSQGFLCDNFDHALNPSIWVNNITNPWSVQNGGLCQNNVSADYVGVAAHYNGASHTAFLYDFYLKFNSGNQCSFFFNCGNAPSQTSLFSGYEVCFDRANHSVTVYRLILGARRLLKTNSQVYFVEGTNYFCRVIFDSSTGEIVVMRHANKLVRAVDRVLTTTENSYIGFVTRNASVCVDNVRVYGSRTDSVPVTVGAAETCMIQNQAVNGLSRTKLKSVVVDRAYKFSQLVEKSLKVDYTPPAPVSDLTLYMENTTLLDGSLGVWVSASWNPSVDEQSGIRRFYVHNPSLLSSQWNANWTDNGLYTTCNHCFSYPMNGLILFGIVAENYAGLRSVPVVKMMAQPSVTPESKNEKYIDIMKEGKSVRMISVNEEGGGHELGHYGFTLFDMTGRKVKEGHFHPNEPVDLSNLSKGMYLFRVSKGKDVLMTEKIVVSN